MSFRQRAIDVLIDESTTPAEREEIDLYVRENRLCGLETPYPRGLISICYRSGNHLGKPCGGELYEFFDIGIEL